MSRGKAAIVETGRVVDGSPVGWLFDHRSDIPDVNMSEDGIILHKGYTVDELRRIAKSRSKKKKRKEEKRAKKTKKKDERKRPNILARRF